MGKLRRFGFICLALEGAVVAPQRSSLAATPAAFDGTWNISIVTEAGSCPSAEIAVNIKDGKVSYMGMPFSGGVDPRGRVSLSISSSVAAGEAGGRMTGDRGRGKWSGALANNACTGRWGAERR
jgi:hypothetical protein